MSNKAKSSSKKLPSRGNDPYFWQAIGLSSLFAVTIPVILGLVVSASNEHAHVSKVSEVGQAEAGGGVQASGLAKALLLNDGKQVFQNACVVCHGAQGEGVRNLGKPLHNSAYVQSQSDDQLFQLIADGRTTTDPANTTGVLMPPRGAVGLDDQQVHQVVAYLRSMQDPSQPTVSMEAWQPKPGEASGGRVAIELSDHAGYDLYIASCAACHGEGAEGIDQLGLPLTTSGFVRGKTDKEMITFIKSGRASWDPSNSTGIDMPPKGGNPAITDDQLQQIVEYLRAVQINALGE